MLFSFRCLVVLNHSAGHTLYAFFLRWLFVAYLKWRSILHIFKKSLASRTAGELASVEIELGANWVLFILCGSLVLITHQNFVSRWDSLDNNQRMLSDMIPSERKWSYSWSYVIAVGWYNDVISWCVSDISRHTWELTHGSALVL